MMHPVKVLMIFLLWIFSLDLHGQSSDLAKNFKNPPSEYSLLPFWSWNGTLKPDKLKWQIDQMIDKGIDGAFMHARGGLDESETPYFSEGFWNAVDTTVRYSALKGFQAYLYDEDKWPSGSAGGRTIAANPEKFVKKVLTYSKMEVVGPQTILLNQQKKPLAIYAGKITEKGIYDFPSQQNLTDKANGTWMVPAGRWAIISFEVVKVSYGQIDYLDSAAVAKFIEITHEAYFKRFGKYFGNTIPGIFFDEIYANGASMDDNIFWTDDFLNKFKALKGYDLTDKLSLIFYRDPAWSAKVRCDYFDVVKQLFVKAWFKQYADWCAAHKIWATGHTTEKLVHYKRQSDYFSTMGQLQVPGADNEEYRYGYPRMVDWYNTKQIRSIANLYNRKRVMAESLGSGGYTIPLEEYRYGLSMLGVYGINLFIPHLFHYTVDTPESQLDWPPSWFFSNPYWKYFRPLADFGKRLSYMNSQGDEVCDVAILYPLTDLWEGGYPAKIDDSFYKEVQQELHDNQINYNIIDPASLSAATIRDKKIEAGSGRYRVLILPEIHAVTSDNMKQISTFVEEGGAVIALKSLPSLSDSGPAEDDLLAACMKKLFGIAPSSLNPEEYYQWNLEKKEHFTTKPNSAGGAAIFTRFLHQMPGIIHSRINPDVLISGDNAQYLRFSHRKAEEKELYLLVNDRNSPEKYHLSLRNKGKPSIWIPETGMIQPFENYCMKEKRMELILDFKPRESYFLVLENGTMDTSGVLIEKSGLDDSRITKSAKSVKVDGWAKPDNVHSVTLEVNNEQITRSWKSKRSLSPVPLNGAWQFQLAPHALDYKWSSALETDTLEIPIMKFLPERSPGEGMKNHWSSGISIGSNWKTVKIKDDYNPKAGIQRYASDWNGWWISYYDYATHLPPTEGGDRTFRKEILLTAGIKEAKMAITADQNYELTINGSEVGSDADWKTAEVYDISRLLKIGSNLLEVRTKNTRGVLLQGYIRLKNGKTVDLKSDESWMVSAGQADWQPAFLFAAPPMGIWGNVPNPLQKTEFPHAVWYQQQLPPGASVIRKPEVKGAYALFVNGLPVNIDLSAKTFDISKLLKKDVNMLALKVVATDSSCGLLQPIGVICGKVNTPLIPWNEMGLSWYSGRALYTKTVVIPTGYLQKDIRLMLDPGQVNYFAEIWVNGKLVTFHPWAPFETEITGFVKEGENSITMVVANLAANKATWNILDDNVKNKDARWWHDGSIRREKEMLVSGLLGPVQIIPYCYESVEFSVK